MALAYEAFCVSEAVDDDGDCEIDGTAFVRAGRRDSFSTIPLQRVSSPDGNRLVARVPDVLLGSPEGFEYFAKLRSTADGASVTIPAGGAAAPHRSLRVLAPIVVDLGAHDFARTREADERVVGMTWGTGALEAGLEEGRNLSPVGASAFDVDRTGSVYLLDEARHRILRWDKRRKTPTRIPVSVSGSLADIAVSPDGSVYVLETVGTAGGRPIVRRFDADGRELEAVETAERTASQIRLGDGGPVVLQQPSHHWMPITSGGAVAGARSQREHGRVERPLPGGGNVVVLRTGSEIRIVLTGRNGERRSWRLLSETPLGEVQLAEPLGNRLVVVARSYTETEAAFEVLLLDSGGLVRRFSVSAAEWAEAAPLGRFKLVGSSLYRLGSTPRGPFVDRFDLEVHR